MATMRTTSPPAAPAAATPDPANRLLTIHQVVATLNLAPATVYRLIERGELLSIKVGKSRRIPARCLDAFVAARIAEAEAEMASWPRALITPHTTAPHRKSSRK